MGDLREFWSKTHIGSDLCYLAGSSPQGVYEAHGVLDDVLGPPKTILEIGVGMGDSACWLAARNHRVLAVDLVPEALDRVKTVAETILTADLPSVGAEQADFGLSHLVFQHCDDEMLEFLLTHALRIVKKTGFFTFQFAFRFPETELPAWLQDGVDKGVLFWRSKHEMLAVCDKIGADVLAVSPPMTFPNQQAVGWLYFWVRARA